MNDQDLAASCSHRELAVGWALHALEPAEESLVAAHLPNCQTCSRIAAQAEDVAASLGLCIPEAIPRAGLEQLVLSVTGSGGAAATCEAPVPLAPSTLPELEVTKSWRVRVGELAVAASVILIAAAVVLGVQVGQLNSELDQASRQVTDLSEAIDRAADPEAVRVPLVADDGTAVGMVLAGRDQVEVVTTRLPSNQADQTYVLWGLADGVPVALAPFDVALQTPSLHTVPSATGTRRFAGYAVSLEPGRRAPSVPTAVVAKGQV
ncbi:MAG: anti-sigma factor [Pseudonocardiaceae bacterium]